MQGFSGRIGIARGARQREGQQGPRSRHELSGSGRRAATSPRSSNSSSRSAYERTYCGPRVHPGSRTGRPHLPCLRSCGRDSAPAPGLGGAAASERPRAPRRYQRLHRREPGQGGHLARPCAACVLLAASSVATVFMLCASGDAGRRARSRASDAGVGARAAARARARRGYFVLRWGSEQGATHSTEAPRLRVVEALGSSGASPRDVLDLRARCVVAGCPGVSAGAAACGRLAQRRRLRPTVSRLPACGGPGAGARMRARAVARWSAGRRARDASGRRRPPSPGGGAARTPRPAPSSPSAKRRAGTRRPTR